MTLPVLKHQAIKSYGHVTVQNGPRIINLSTTTGMEKKFFQAENRN